MIPVHRFAIAADGSPLHEVTHWIAASHGVDLTAYGLDLPGLHLPVITEGRLVPTPFVEYVPDPWGEALGMEATVTDPVGDDHYGWPLPDGVRLATFAEWRAAMLRRPPGPFDHQPGEVKSVPHLPPSFLIEPAVTATTDRS